MNKLLNILYFFLILIFFLSTFKFYSSNKNIINKQFNRKNINQIINTKISDLPILENDTEKVIEFNDGFTSEINNGKKRSFWNLLNNK
jgi:hypothetical protein